MEKGKGTDMATTKHILMEERKKYEHNAVSEVLLMPNWGFLLFLWPLRIGLPCFEGFFPETYDFWILNYLLQNVSENATEISEDPANK